MTEDEAGSGEILPSETLQADFTEKAYHDAMALVTETVNYLEGRGVFERDDMDPLSRAVFAAESMRHTTRLMQVVAWFLVQHAVAKGELSKDEAVAPSRRLGAINVCLGEAREGAENLPPRMRDFLARSRALFEQVLRIEALMLSSQGGPKSPVHDLLKRLQ